MIALDLGQPHRFWATSLSNPVDNWSEIYKKKNAKHEKKEEKSNQNVILLDLKITDILQM